MTVASNVETVVYKKVYTLRYNSDCKINGLIFVYIWFSCLIKGFRKQYPF